MAGVSINEPYHLSELVFLAHARGEFIRQEAWSVASAIRADICNLLAKHPRHPNEFNPMLKGAAKRKGVKKSGVLMPSDIARMAEAGAFGKVKGK